MLVDHCSRAGFADARRHLLSGGIAQLITATRADAAEAA